MISIRDIYVWYLCLYTLGDFSMSTICLWAAFFELFFFQRVQGIQRIPKSTFCRLSELQGAASLSHFRRAALLRICLEDFFSFIEERWDVISHFSQHILTSQSSQAWRTNGFPQTGLPLGVGSLWICFFPTVFKNSFRCSRWWLECEGKRKMPELRTLNCWIRQEDGTMNCLTKVNILDVHTSKNIQALKEWGLSFPARSVVSGVAGAVFGRMSLGAENLGKGQVQICWIILTSQSKSEPIASKNKQNMLRAIWGLEVKLDQIIMAQLPEAEGPGRCVAKSFFDLKKKSTLALQCFRFWGESLPTELDALASLESSQLLGRRCFEMQRYATQLASVFWIDFRFALALV